MWLRKSLTWFVDLSIGEKIGLMWGAMFSVDIQLRQ